MQLRLGFVVALAAALLADARPANAQCTEAKDASQVLRTARARARCNSRALRAGPATPCLPAPPDPPACAGTLVDDAMALTWGPNDPAAGAVDRQALRTQLSCQEALGRATARFIGVKLKNLISGRSHADAEARARRSIDSLAKSKRCQVPVAQDATSAVVLPAVGQPCSATLGAPGRAADPDALRACLIPALEAMVDRVAPSPPPRPSFLVILTDDQRWDTTGLEHSVDGLTPVMPEVQSELAASGVDFPNAFVSTALCCPSRSSILTGQNSHTTGVLTNTQPLGGAPNFRDVSTLATWLRAAGYRTGFYGKYLNGYSSLWTAPQLPYVPPGWDEWHALKGARFYDFTLVEHGAGFDHAQNLYPSGCASYRSCPGDLGGCSSPTNYSTEVLVDKLLEFLDTQPADQPFFLYLTPYAPHDPACPAKQDEGSFASLAPWRPPNWNESDVSDKPDWVQNLCPMKPSKQASIDAFRRKQLESLQAVDRGVGEIMDKLRALGRDADTVVLFTGDNGYSWGAHCHGPKRCPYDECSRVPLVVRYPRLAPVARTETRQALNIDFAFTFAELAGLVPPIQQDGRSLAGLLDGSEPFWRPDFLYEQWLDADDEDSQVVPPTLAGVRSPEWKYVEYVSGETELYDLVADPYELENKTGDPAHAERKAELAARLRQLRPDWPPPGSPSGAFLDPESATLF